jgi:hypothetical protein
MVQKNPNRYEWKMPLELLFLGQERYEVTRLKEEERTTTLRPKIELYGVLPNDLKFRLRRPLLQF